MLFVKSRREAEVCKLDVTSTIEEDIVRLDITALKSAYHFPSRKAIYS